MGRVRPQEPHQSDLKHPIRQHDDLVGGEWTAGARHSPNLGDTIAEHTQDDATHVEAAATAAFPAWVTGSIQACSDALDRIGTQILARKDDLGSPAGIATTSLKHATRLRRHGQAGVVMVNLATAGVDYRAPFSGRKGLSYVSRKQDEHVQEVLRDREDGLHPRLRPCLLERRDECPCQQMEQFVTGADHAVQARLF